jgi:hypothetical protein
MPKFHSMAWQASNNRRKFPRSRLRIPCQLRLPDADHPGFVLDLGPTGLFVQTAATAAPGTAVKLTLRDPSQPPFELAAKVARKRASHRSAAIVLAQGLGLEVENAPEAYFQLVLELDRKRSG